MTGGLTPGTLLAGRYRILRLLAEGGMGAVYEAQHVELERRVAIKTLLSELQEQPRLIARFIREARATCMIAHPNVVSVLDVDQTADGLIFFAMEYLVGADIDEVLEREGPMGWQRARDIALQVCSALAAAHERGIVHRDLKPANCFLVKDDTGERVKVLDFGIAKVLESNNHRAGGPRGAGPRTGRELGWLRTTTGEVFGTLAYMAPEHLNGDAHDHRVDIYALGVILYEMITGTTPFSPDAPGTFIQQVLFEPPEPPSRRAPSAGIPPDLDYVVMRALEKRPEERFSSMNEMAEALIAARRDAAPRIAAVPWSAIPVVAPASSLSVPELPTKSTAPRRAWSGVRVGLGLVAVLATAALGLVMVVAPKGEPTVARREGAVEPAAVATVPAVVAPDGSPKAASLEVAGSEAVSPEVAGPEAASTVAMASVLEPASPEAGAGEPVVGTRAARAQVRAPSAARARDLPAMNVTPYERRALFAPHRDAVTARCKRPLGLENALIVLEITIASAQIVRAEMSGEGDADRKAAARCIRKYVRGEVSVPKTLSGRATFSYAF